MMTINQGTISLVEEATKDLTNLSFEKMSLLYGHSLVLGFIIAGITFISAYFLYDEDEKVEELVCLIQSCSNMLFLCVGLTGVMVLVNNNIARAFAIGAALALVRFRVKLGAKKTAANLLFAIIIGLACGLDEKNVAWGATVIYSFIVLLLTTALYIAQKRVNLRNATKEP